MHQTPSTLKPLTQILSTTDGKHILAITRRDGSSFLFQISRESIPAITASGKPWCLLSADSGNKRYAYQKDAAQKNVYLHRAIMGLKDGDKHQVDHISADTLDCRLENLRVVTKDENRRHRILNNRLYKHNKSGASGVLKCGNKWSVTVAKQYHGMYPTFEQAKTAVSKIRRAINVARIAAIQAPMQVAA